MPRFGPQKSSCLTSRLPGLIPVTVQNVQVVIKELSQAGIAVLITDHAAREILQITDRTYVVSEGRILCSGTAEQIVAHDEVKKKYLGEIEMPTTRVDVASDGTATRNATEQPPTSVNSADTESTARTAPIAPIQIPKTPNAIEEEQEVISMFNAISQNDAADQPERKSDRPRIVFPNRDEAQEKPPSRLDQATLNRGVRSKISLTFHQRQS